MTETTNEKVCDGASEPKCSVQNVKECVVKNEQQCQSVNDRYMILNCTVAFHSCIVNCVHYCCDWWIKTNASCSV